jgi:hypothetical protein
MGRWIAGFPTIRIKPGSAFVSEAECSQDHSKMGILISYLGKVIYILGSQE